MNGAYFLTTGSVGPRSCVFVKVGATKRYLVHLKTSRAFETEDSCVIVRFDNDFALRMMEQGDARDKLRAAVSSVLRREVGDRALIFEVAGKNDDRSVIDEIIDALATADQAEKLKNAQ